MRILKGFLMVMGALAILAICGLILGYVLAILTPDIKANLRPVVLSSESVDSFNNKIAEITAPIKPPGTNSGTGEKSSEVTITLTEEEVNSKIVMAMAEGTIPSKEMLVNFNDGYMVLYSAWNFSAFPAKTVIIGSFDIEDKKPKFLLTGFYLGKLPLPSSMNSNIQELANIMIRTNPTIYNSRTTYKEITISEGKVKIVGTIESGNGAASTSK